MSYDAFGLGLCLWDHGNEAVFGLVRPVQHEGADK